MHHNATAQAHQALNARVDLTRIRYAQCWEDADILLAAVRLAPGSRCLSVASAGDNTLALLTQSPREVVALDMNPAQLSCLALRVAAYKTLTHAELLGFIGARPCMYRPALYQRCRKALSKPGQIFWDARPLDIACGLGAIGRFENYFSLFRRRVLPWVHGSRTIAALCSPKSQTDRQHFYSTTWNSWRWRVLFRLFFSRTLMGRVGRDPEFFRYVEGDVANRLMSRTRHALTTLDPATNPYLHWILFGNYGEALPLALRAEHFNTIRDNLDRLSWRSSSVEDYLDDHPHKRFDAFNLSDIFEYMSQVDYAAALARLVKSSAPHARLVYWNMLAERTRPQHLAPQLKPLTRLAAKLHAQDKAFFYSRLVIEEVCS